MMNCLLRIAVAGLSLAFVASGLGVVMVAYFAAEMLADQLVWRWRDALLMLAIWGAIPVSSECFRTAWDLWSFRRELRAQHDSRPRFPRARARKRRWRPSVIP